MDDPVVSLLEQVIANQALILDKLSWMFDVLLTGFKLGLAGLIVVWIGVMLWRLVRF